MDIKCLTVGDRYWGRGKEAKVHISLDTIFDNFTNVKKLAVCASGNITFSEELSSLAEKPKSNLECMEFHLCDLKQNTFHKLSALCPNLKVLKLMFCRFTSPLSANGMPNCFRHIYIHLPSTHLQELHLTISLDLLTTFYLWICKKSVIRVETFEGEIEYFKITLMDSQDGENRPYYDIVRRQYTNAYYEKCVRNEDYLTYDIYCKSIQKLFVKAANGRKYECPSFFD